MFEKKPKFISERDILNSVNSLEKLSNRKKPFCCNNTSKKAEIKEEEASDNSLVQVLNGNDLKGIKKLIVEEIKHSSKLSTINKKSERLKKSMERYDGDDILWNYVTQ